MDETEIAIEETIRDLRLLDLVLAKEILITSERIKSFACDGETVEATTTPGSGIRYELLEMKRILKEIRANLGYVENQWKKTK